MKRCLWSLALAAGLAACDAGDLHRIAGISQGTLAVGLGVPMSEVARRSSVTLHRSPDPGLSSGSYNDGNAYFDFELLNSTLRFHGCSMYMIDYKGHDEVVSTLSLFITPKSLRWRAFGDELRETAAKLKADGWEVQPHLKDGWRSLESFLALDVSKIQTTPSDVVGTFEWKKGETLLGLSAHRAWDGPDFWASLDLAPADLFDPEKAVWWPAALSRYPGALGLCSRNAPDIGEERKPAERAWAMFGSIDEPAAVIAFYAAERGLKPAPGATTLKLESKDGKTQLAIYPNGGSYTEDCGVHPVSDKTILVASEMP